MKAMFLGLVLATFPSAAALAGDSAMVEDILDECDRLEAEDGVKRALRERLEDYAEDRGDRVEELAETLDPNHDREVKDRWVGSARSIADWSEDWFDDLEEEFDEHPEVVDLIGAARIRERQHFLSLANSKLPALRDRLWERTGELIAKREELDKEWAALKRKDGAVDQKYRATVKELQELYAEAIEKEVEYRGKMGENLGRLAAKYPELAKEVAKKIVGGAAAVVLKDPGAVSMVEGAAEIAVDYNEIFLSLYSKLQERIRIAVRLVQTERNILIMFAGTRDGVESFLETYNLANIDHTFDEAEDLTDDLESRDEALAEEVLEHLERMQKAYHTAFESFVDAHEHIFFGALGTEGIEELLEVREHEAQYRTMRSHKIADLLSRKYLSGDVAFNVSFSGLSEVDREYLFEDILEPQVKRTIDAVRKLAEQLDTTLEDVLEHRIETLRDVVD